MYTLIHSSKQKNHIGGMISIDFPAAKVFIGRDRNMRDRLVAIKKVIIFEDAKKKAFLQAAQIMKDRLSP